MAQSSEKALYIKNNVLSW